MPILPPSPLASPASTGWPWHPPSSLPHPAPTLDPAPRISLVTPSFNQGHLLEETIRSVLLQNYPNLEYYVIDGGSQDGTVDVLRHYQPWLTGWTSERDRGQSHAINKGFQRVGGELVGWLNSDDLLEPGALAQVAAVYREHPEADVIYGDSLYVDAANRPVAQRSPAAPFDFHRLLQHNLIPQPSAFLARQALRPPLRVREDLHFIMDYMLWLELAERGCRFHFVPEVWSRYRLHDQSKTCSALFRFQHEVLQFVYTPRLRASPAPPERQAIRRGLQTMTSMAYASQELVQVRKLAFWYARTARQLPPWTVIRLALQSCLGPRLLARVRSWRTPA